MAIMWIPEHLCLVMCVVRGSMLTGIAIFVRRILITALMNVFGPDISHLNILFTIVALKQFVHVVIVLTRTRIAPFVLKGKRMNAPKMRCFHACTRSQQTSNIYFNYFSFQDL